MAKAQEDGAEFQPTPHLAKNDVHAGRPLKSTAVPPI